MELIKLKDADIIELGSPATFCRGIKLVPGSVFNCKIGETITEIQIKVISQVFTSHNMKLFEDLPAFWASAVPWFSFSFSTSLQCGSHTYFEKPAALTQVMPFKTLQQRPCRLYMELNVAIEWKAKKQFNKQFLLSNVQPIILMLCITSANFFSNHVWVVVGN